MKEEAFPTIISQQVAGVLVITIRESRISEGSVIESLRQEIEQAITGQNNQRVVLDFSAVELMSSETLGLLIRLYRDLAESGGRIVLCGVREPIQKVLAVTRLDQLFRIAPNIEAALRVAASENAPQP